MESKNENQKHDSNNAFDKQNITFDDVWNENGSEFYNDKVVYDAENDTYYEITGVINKQNKK